MPLKPLIAGQFYSGGGASSLAAVLAVGNSANGLGITDLATLGFRDTNNAGTFNTTLTFTSTTQISAARSVTLDLNNTDQTLKFTGASTVTFPSGTNTLAVLAANTFTALQTVQLGVDVIGGLWKGNIAAGTSIVQLGGHITSITYGGLWGGNNTPSATNYAVISNGSTTYVGGTSAVRIGIGGVAAAAEVLFSTSGIQFVNSSTPYFGWTDLFLYRDAAATLQLGANNATTPTNQTLKAHNVTSAGTGASLTLCGGTGTVAGGAVNIATSITTAAAVKHITIAANGDIVIATDAARKIGFFGVTPVAQQGSIADPGGDSGVGIDTIDKTTLDATLSTLQSAVSSIIYNLESLGLQATV